MSEYSLAISEAEIRRYMMMAERAQASEAALWQSAGIVPGAVVADVGCGPAAVSVCMAAMVAPAGRVIGVDFDEAALAAAKRVVEHAGAGNVELVLGRAAGTGLAPGSADVAVLRHVLGHNGSGEQPIVDHLAGLVRPGGAVYLVDVDWTAGRLLGANAGFNDLQAKYVQFHQGRGNDGQSGLRLGQLLVRAGLEVVTHDGRYAISTAPRGARGPAWAARDSLVAAGIATRDDVEYWQESFDRMDNAQPRPTVFVAYFYAIGRKPS
ncbi:MAG TPA: methyltransferase domain-containing protein [Streptosporangiaceae bacterium]|jgi:precorrin-6B methylase 2